MPLETASYISDLNVANPAHTDGLQQADSHMRLLKSTIKATFPNFTAVALQSTQADIDLASQAAAGNARSRFPLGTVALPSVTPTGDVNTGIYSPAADQLAVSLNGVQVLLMAPGLNQSNTPFAAPSVQSTGAYSGGTGQLVPIGGTLIWWDDVLPTEGGYAWANGQIIASANTVCPILLARWGTRFGGNGTTTMGVPDLRDTVPVGKSTMGAVASRALHTLTNTVLGALIGAANVVLTTLNLPPHTHSGVTGNENQSHTHGFTGAHGGANNAGGAAGGLDSADTTGPNNTSHNHNFTTDSGPGTSTAHNNVQPSTTCNYIIRLS